MKFVITLLVVTYASTLAWAVLEDNKLQIRELSTIESEARRCVEVKQSTEDCQYKCALENLKYDSTADPDTLKYRKLCHANTTTVEGECLRMQEFVYCLHRAIQDEVNALRDVCVNKHNADMQEYRNAGLDVLIKDQRFACFMFCFQKAMGVMDDNLDVHLEADARRDQKLNVTQAIQECKGTNQEETQCSKAAHIYYCLEEKINGRH